MFIFFFYEKLELMKVLEICILDLFFFCGHIEPFREWMDFDFSEPSSAEYIKLVKVSALLTQCCKITHTQKKEKCGIQTLFRGARCCKCRQTTLSAP